MKRTIALVLSATALVALCVSAQAVPSSSAGYIRSITNTTNTAATTSAAFTCAYTYGVDKGTALFQYPLTESGISLGASAADISGKNATGTYRPILGAINSTTTAPQGCARDALGAYTLNGSSNFVSTPTQYVNPQVFSEEIWFKTSVAGGKLIGFGNQQSTSSGQYDRHVYINTSGQLVFGIYNSGYNTIVGTPNVANNTWHHMVATFSTTTGMALYLDGVQVAANVAFNAAEPTTGYWRIGWDNLGGWPNVGNNYFTGQLRYAAVYSSVLTANQVLIHYNSGK